MFLSSGSGNKFYTGLQKYIWPYSSGECNNIYMMHILRLQMSEFWKVTSTYLCDVWNNPVLAILILYFIKTKTTVQSVQKVTLAETP
jgi:hypothetical protein